MKRHTSKILALSLAFIMTLMTIAPYQAGFGYSFANDGAAAEAADTAEDAAKAADESVTEEPAENADAVENAATGGSTDAMDAGEDSTQLSNDSETDKENEAASEADSVPADDAADAEDSDSADEPVDADLTGADDAAKEESAVEAEPEDADEASSEAAPTIEFKGKEFDVTIESTPDAGLPDDTALKVKEITAKDKRYKDYYERVLGAVQSEADESDTKTVRFVRLYDMTLTADGEAVEPDAAVDVTFDYSKAVEAGKAEAAEDADGVKVVHFKEGLLGKEKAELLDKDAVGASVEESALTEAKFTADSFSVYAVVYTVDFHYGDGEYDFSIAGESSIMLSEVIERLHMEPLTINDVRDAKFSDPDLVKVEKVGGAVDAGNGTAPADDWKLTSLKAFSTDEKLTLTLNDGTEVEVGVADEQTDPANATFKVTGYGNDFDTLYFEHLKEAVDYANTNNRNNNADASATTITMLKDYTLGVEDSGVIIKPARHQVILDGADKTLSFSDNQSGGLQITNASYTNDVRMTSIKNLTLVRNTYTGKMISIEAAAGPVTLSDCILDGSNNANARGALLSINGYNLTLSNTVVKNHNTSDAGICAVESTNVSGGVVNVSGTTTITGNTSAGKAANLYVLGKSNLKVNDDLSGTIGVTAQFSQESLQFASCATNKTGYDKLVNDKDSDLIGTLSGTTNIIWGAKPTAQKNFAIGSNQYKTLQGAFNAATNNAVITGLVSEYTVNERAENNTSPVTIQPGDSGKLTLKRGDVTGDMITASKALTLKNVTLDGDNKDSEGSLLKMRENVALTLSDTVVKKHTSDVAGICAVDASTCTTANYVNVSGNTIIKGNTSEGKPANLKVNGTNVLRLSDSLTGIVGVTSDQGEAQQFATRAANKTGCEMFVNDKDSDLIGALSGNDIIWKAKNGALLSFAINNNKYKTLQGAFNAATANAVIKGLVETYTLEGTESCDKYAVTVQPGDNFDWLTLKRGTADGDMITSSKSITFKKVVLDGQSIKSTGSLLKINAAVALNMTDVTVRNHSASTSGVCAVDAEASSSVTLDKATTITGNTADGSAANLKIPADASKTKVADLSGRVGITSENNGANQCFAHLNSNSVNTGIAFLYNDANRVMRAVEGSGGGAHGIYWSMAQRLPSSRFYITGNLSYANNVTLYYDTLEEAIDVSTDFVGSATISSMVSEYTMTDPISVSHDVLIKPGQDASGNAVSRLTIYRGEELGTLITHNSGQLTLQDVTLDGQKKSVTGPLLRSSGGAGNLVFDNATVCNHNASEAAIYAIDASDNRQKIKLQGNTSITGNTANSSPANLCVVGVDKLSVSGDLTGSVGVTNLLHEQPGDQFGVLEQPSYTIGNITNDLRANNSADKDGTKLVWEGSTVSTGNLVKLTDGTNILKRKSGNTLVDAIYTSVNGNNSAVSDVNGNNLYNADGTKYNGKVYFEFLQDRVDIGDSGVQITKTRDLVFKTASKPAEDGHPFEGSGTRTKIVFTNGGGGANTDKRFIFTGDGSKIRFENIIVDGRADQGIEADQGGLVSVGDRASTHDIQVTLGDGAVFQNGASNSNDQGGGFYVGNGCKLYMEPGSIIQYCNSSDGNDASGGAIYLAMGELHCNGGIIRNCICSKGGAIDCGGSTDGSVSDKARVYFSGSPQIINNYDNSGNPLNYHLNYDSNSIITISGDIEPGAKIGVSADGQALANHSKEGQPFGNIVTGADVKNLSSFVNDKDPRLTGALGVGSGNENLAVWFYQMNAYASDDYMIDGELIRATELEVSEGTYEPDILPTTFTVAELEAAYHRKNPYICFKKADFSGISLEAYDTNTGITSGITNFRYTTHEHGRRWEYSMDNGEHWFPVNGREFVFHYTRENRDNIKLVKKEDTSTSEVLANAMFRLERSYPDDSAYTLYTNGAGNGNGSVTDTSAEGIYTTDSNGEFIMNLPEGYYRLTETKAPEGYADLAAPVTFHVGVTSVKDTPDNKRISPYSVDAVSTNAVYAGNDYDAWKSNKVFGSLTVNDTRQVPLHILVQTGVDEYELKDSMLTTELVTAPLDSTTTIGTALNPAPTGYVNYKIYYGSETGGTYNFAKSGNTPVEVTSLQGTANGILVNGQDDQVLTKDQAIYYVIYQNPRSVPYHILLNDKGTITEKAEWATTGTKRTKTHFNVDESGVQVDNAYEQTKTEDGKTYRLSKVVYADAQPASMSEGTELSWLVNTPEAVAARSEKNAEENIGSLTSSSKIYYIYSSGCDLTITKDVSGDYANMTGDYTFTVELPEKSEAYEATKYASASDTTGTAVTGLTTTGGGFSLKNGERIVIKDIELDQEVKVTETQIGDGTSDGNTGSYKVTATFNDESKVSGKKFNNNEELSNGSSVAFTIKGDVTLTIGNILNGVVPSGLKIASGVLAFALIIVLGTLYMITTRRRRRA